MSDDRFDNRRYYNEDTFSIQSTAGAIPVKNKKGEISMEKVKVHRYVSGKRPEYAKTHSDSSSESESSDEEDFTKKPKKLENIEEDDELFIKPEFQPPEVKEEDFSDPRLRRLRAARESSPSQNQGRRVHEPEILSDEESEPDQRMAESDSSSDNEDLDDEGIENRRKLMRQKALAIKDLGVGQEEVMAKEDEKEASEEEDDEDETTEESETDSENEEGARLKPVFVRKQDRLTQVEREKEEAKQRQIEREANILAEQRRRDTLRMVENSVKLEAEERRKNEKDDGIEAVITDDENEEIEYEAWKLRELKRLKRDRDEKEEREKEAAEVERLRNMTEEERRLELKMNPKKVTNKASKGKYKFLQKYYHRGAFFLDKEENVFTRDVTSATLEDKFDKTVLPKVMQVKNFGRSGRTKYTHLVDQDTTQFDAAWSQESAQNMKFQVNHAAGMKSQFERPSSKKKK